MVSLLQSSGIQILLEYFELKFPFQSAAAALLASIEREIEAVADADLDSLTLRQLLQVIDVPDVLVGQRSVKRFIKHHALRLISKRLQSR
jgi:hypothetical protein